MRFFRTQMLAAALVAAAGFSAAGASAGSVGAGVPPRVAPPAEARGTEDPNRLVRERNDLSPKDVARVRAVTQPTTDFGKAERYEMMQGGAGTSRKLVNRDSFSQPSANLSFEDQATFQIGNGFFTKDWIAAPSSTHASDGLGPLFNARSCQDCHLKDGRGHPPEGDGNSVSMFLRLARPPAHAVDAHDKAALKAFLADARPDPVYGGQFQDNAVAGLKAEGRMTIAYDDEPVRLKDGTVVHLRKPRYGVADLAYGAMALDTTLSPRIAPPMIGLGLVEAISPADILAHADPDDRDHDGVSGKAGLELNRRTGALDLARFGWKASVATIREQGASAFSGDIGISTPDAPSPYGECTRAEAACLAMPTGVQKAQGDTEAPDPVMDLVTFYSQNLAVPARRDVDDPTVLHGKALFYGAGCTGCHTPKYVTRRDALHAAQAFQLIWPYSDFLLHDMGPGLADGQQVGVATGNEWRTPPLWGIGLTRTVSGHTFFLHDGRARNLTEAILWHGGEAKRSRDAFAAMEAKDRAALLKFLESL